MALTENYPLHHVRGEQSEFPQGAVKIYEGGLLGQSGGYARGLVAGDLFIGHAAEYYDNSGSAPGDHQITRYRGRYRLEVTLAGVAGTDVGKEVYASADDTLALTPGDNSRVGVVDRYVRTDTAIVEFQTSEPVDANVATSASFIWVSPDGSDTSGNGSFSNPFASVRKALTAVTATRKTILLMPGEYTEALSLTWPSLTGVSLNGALGHGDAVTITGTAGQTQVISIDPTVQTATFEVLLSNLTISCPNGVRGITFNNTAVNRKINLYLHNVQIENDTDTDRAISVVHTNAGQAMRIYADGQKTQLEGLVYIEPKNTDDRFTFDGYQFDGGVQFGTTDIASVTTFKDCIMKKNGGAGGHNSQILNSLGCYSLTGTLYAAALEADFAANAAEVIL